jgi:hypothetical protein
MRAFVLVGDRDDLLGDLVRAADGRGGVHDQHRVHFRRLEQDLHGVGVALPGSIADDVDRVGARPGRRQHPVQLGHGLVGQRRQGPAQVDQVVDRHHPDAAAVGQDGQPLAVQAALVGDGLHRLEQLLQVVHPQDAGAAEGGVVDVVGPGQGAGVGGGGLGALGHAAGLDGQHRLVAGGGAGRRDELAGVADGLDVEQDGADVRMGAQIVDGVAEVDVEVVAQGDEMREADAARRGPVQHRRAQGAGLADEGHLAGLGRLVQETGVETQAGHQQADAVRPQQAHPIFARRLQHRLLCGAPVLHRDLPEAGGDDHGGEHPAGAQGIDDPGHRLGRHADHRHVRGDGQGLDRRIGQNAGNRLVGRVHRHDRPFESALEQISHQQRADRARAVRGADDRDRRRRKQTIQIPSAHDVPPTRGSMGPHRRRGYRFCGALQGEPARRPGNLR